MKKINNKNKLNFLRKNVSIQFLSIVIIVFGWTQNVRDTKGTQFTFSIYLIKWTNRNHYSPSVHQNRLKKSVLRWISICKVSNKKLLNSLIKSKLFLMNVRILKIKSYSKDSRLFSNHYFSKVKKKWKNSPIISLDKKSKEQSKKSNLIESIFLFLQKYTHQFL